MFPMPMYGRGPTPIPLPVQARPPRYGGPPMAGPEPMQAPTAMPARPMRPVLGQFHKGGKVPKTGAYQLKKGEHVVPVGKGKLTAAKRNALPTKTFGLPGSRKYPMPDKSHAANAKARATQMVKKGKLSAGSASKIRAKASRILGEHKMVSVSALKA